MYIIRSAHQYMYMFSVRVPTFGYVDLISCTVITYAYKYYKKSTKRENKIYRHMRITRIKILLTPIVTVYGKSHMFIIRAITCIRRTPLQQQGQCFYFLFFFLVTITCHKIRKRMFSHGCILLLRFLRRRFVFMTFAN